MSCNGGKAYIRSPRLQGSAIKVSQSLMGTARLMRCGNGTYYLRVTPSVVWLASESGARATVKVESNVGWRVK